MKSFPHIYNVTASAMPDGDVELTADRLPFLLSAPPAEFGGPGDRWSPETLLAAAVGDCFVLTFRAIARAAKLPWTALQCGVTGTLDRVDQVARFTDFTLGVRLELSPGSDARAGYSALEKAKQHCLVSNSLQASTHVQSDVVVARAVERETQGV
jgi:organic hydroperoxide reductase OsmC/OhrA